MTNNTATAHQPQAVNPDMAAWMLGLGRSTTYRLIKDGQLRSVKVGRRRLIPMSEIERLLSA